MVMQQGCYPVSGLSVDAIIFEFTEQAFMSDMIKHKTILEAMMKFKDNFRDRTFLLS